MQAQTTDVELLKPIVAAATILLPGVSWAALAVSRHERVVAQHPTDDIAQDLADVQAILGEGPAITALAEHTSIVVPDLGTETRWPRFTTAATARGVHCLMAFRLFVHDRVLGALTMYGPTPNTFTEESVLIGEILAQHVSVALAGSAAESRMRTAIDTRDIIGQAKGILMQRDSLTGLQAFALLTRASQHTNVKLVDVARFLVQETEESNTRGPQGLHAEGGHEESGA
ncbi:GAF and ANTAR domain-containing protein [Mycobacterium yunnanensis]|uniref:GAF and ANTAR domain-containing protein n=2 Tax=Mycobacterium yunnanensis TaxID=368477 RepID=A0A9X2YJT5_9MYCO|nr:GAF and ANTAR domain-containing protein [Mycobacterium yunnanensis]